MSVTCVKKQQKIYVKDVNQCIIVRSCVKSLIGLNIKVNVLIDKVSSHSYKMYITYPPGFGESLKNELRNAKQGKIIDGCKIFNQLMKNG